jgi:hypothetical protein
MVPASDGNRRISSAAFKDSRREVSVHYALDTDRQTVLRDYPRMGLAELLASIPRQVNHGVCRDPIPNDPSHSLIFPLPGLSRNAIDRAATRMAAEATLIVDCPSP